LTISIKDKIIGVFLGTMIGDALGMPVETMSYEDIKLKYGKINSYLSPKNHKWFSDSEAGMYTDDTQLTFAVADALIESDLSMDGHVKYHIRAFNETTNGWGNSTRNSIRRLINGCSYENSYEEPTENGKGIGGGNGVPMKVAPFGVLMSKHLNPNFNCERNKDIINNIIKLSSMTHGTSISISAGLVQACMIRLCFDCEEPSEFLNNFEKYLLVINSLSNLGKNYFKNTVNEDDLTDRLFKLYVSVLNPDTKDLITDDYIVSSFGRGSCYCYNSLPFTHAFFLRNPNNIDSLFECVSAGGDTDSNGSMIGAMLGALNGYQIFPTNLVADLLHADLAYDIANSFYDKFFVK
jgi:ADP-ribosylglycohydrolase